MKRHFGISSLLNIMTSLTSWTAGLCVVGVVGLTGVEILGRWVFDFTTRGSEEITAYMVVGVTYLGLAYTFVKGGHIKIDMFFKRLSPGWQDIATIVHGILGVCFCAVITYYSSKLVAQNIAFSSRSSSTWAVPLVIPSILIPIGMGNLGLLMLTYTIERIRSLRLHNAGITGTDNNDDA